jgi:multidrug resistance protein MdtO
MKGCLAATICYITYSALFWPEISTSVTTCFLTALSTVGASRQKQALRMGGAIVGGFGFGMGAQVFILPYLDSIAAFTVLFMIVSAAAAWIITSSPRLSYLGVQVAFAFYLITLSEFKFQTSLAVARDRVVGILLGLVVMWVVFDRLWSIPAGIAMRRAFAQNLRLLAQLAREPISQDHRESLERTFSLREAINAQSEKVRSLADAVLFEFGPSRRTDLQLRDYVRHAQTHLRALFVMRIASLKYRLQLPGFDLADSVRLSQQAYDEHSAQMLEEMVGLVEHGTSVPEDRSERSRELLKNTLEAAQDARAESFITLLRGIDDLTATLTFEIGSEFPRIPPLPPTVA